MAQTKVREIRVSGTPATGAPPSPRLGRALRAVTLAPIYGILGSLCGVPGMWIHLMAASLGVRLLLAGGDVRRAFRLVLAPLDSVRYFELDTIWRWLPTDRNYRYLDVSSPRLLPMLVVDRRRNREVVMVNPDLRDLGETSHWLDIRALQGRCLLTACMSEHPPFLPDSFDVITSVSVIEHIPEDTTAVRALWGLLTPGGRLLLTVPCATEAAEEYTDADVYGLLAPNRNGLWFWQRFYDPLSLSQRIFSVTGSPAKMACFGEKSPGRLAQNALRKWNDREYPYWREPYLVATEFRRYRSIEDMPGQGVVAMEFRKPAI